MGKVFANKKENKKEFMRMEMLDTITNFLYLIRNTFKKNYYILSLTDLRGW